MENVCQEPRVFYYLYGLCAALNQPTGIMSPLQLNHSFKNIKHERDLICTHAVHPYYSSSAQQRQRGVILNVFFCGIWWDSQQAAEGPCLYLCAYLHCFHIEIYAKIAVRHSQQTQSAITENAGVEMWGQIMCHSVLPGSPKGKWRKLPWYEHSF